MREITDALRGVSHNGFPVVRDSSMGQVYTGLLTRSHIMALLQHIVVEGGAWRGCELRVKVFTGYDR